MKKAGRQDLTGHRSVDTQIMGSRWEVTKGKHDHRCVQCGGSYSCENQCDPKNLDDSLCPKCYEAACAQPPDPNRFGEPRYADEAREDEETDDDYLDP